MLEKLRIDGKRGFTLVELALVLVIVGLLITGVLKGEALIQNSKIKKLVNEKDSMSAAFYTFYDRFNQYPGDENVAGPTGDPAAQGNANGQIDAAEEGMVFQDLMLAQIISGNYTGAATSLPPNAFGGTIAVTWNALQSSNCIRLTSIPQDIAEQIDRKYDNGTWNGGTIRSDTAYNVNPPTTKTLTWRM